MWPRQWSTSALTRGKSTTNCSDQQKCGGFLHFPHLKTQGSTTDLQILQGCGGSLPWKLTATPKGLMGRGDGENSSPARDKRPILVENLRESQSIMQILVRFRGFRAIWDEKLNSWPTGITPATPVPKCGPFRIAFNGLNGLNPYPDPSGDTQPFYVQGDSTPLHILFCCGTMGAHEALCSSPRL